MTGEQTMFFLPVLGNHVPLKSAKDKNRCSLKFGERKLFMGEDAR